MKSRRSWTPRLIILNALSAAALFCTPLHALEFTSGAQQTQLIELYTSEGCSSCPPADRWLSQFKTSTQLWQDFVPVAYHVDYWDYIGWKDRFASPSYSNRQRKYARENSLRTVYTPGFVYNGKEWRNWFVRRLLDFPDARETGILKLNVQDQNVSVDFDPISKSQQPSRVHVALLGFDVKTQVDAGENHGRTLTHDFVVLGLDNATMNRNGELFSATLDLPKAKVKSNRYAVAAWVSSANAQAPLQSVGGWLTE